MMFTTTTKAKIFASLFFFLKVNAFTINPPLGQRIRPVAPSTFTKSTTTSQLFMGEEIIGNVGVNSEGSGIKYDVSIEYCTGCKWMLRSAWLGQELLSTFQEDESLRSVTLVPSRPPAPGGTFIVTLNGKEIWNRQTDGGFPEAKVLKQKVRDIISPSKDLGHSDVAASAADVDAEASVVSNEDCEECDEEESLPGGEEKSVNRGVKDILSW
eukprot:CAMPEP_0178963022 /NCGR_PEP_ID=MMETSP0789-20121207/14750_1 /TAXON_ID=3005 /ORGANISM="Rhizosolenia setigera, Strain CCMP 1694" /LENGTH=211 /DNA_ID=CAMNT_0020647359 /DNA_START=63 /DNA_END=698 /DNA_ORIENTATION=-